MQNRPGDMQLEAGVMGARVQQMESEMSGEPLRNGTELRESGYLIAVGSRTARFRKKHTSKLGPALFLLSIIGLFCLALSMTILYIQERKMKPMPICKSKECLRAAANLAVSMDTSVNPCEDFYEYACGRWSAEHPRPDVYRSYDWFRDKQLKVYSMLRDFLAENTSEVEPKPVQQAKHMYTACTNTALLDKLGVRPVLKILKKIGLPPVPTYVNVKEDFDYSTYSFDWLEAVIKIKTFLGMDVLIGFDIFTDPKNSSLCRLAIGSPETTDPFPGTYTNKKSTTCKKNINGFVHKQRTRKSEVLDDETDEEDKKKEIFISFYAELIKKFVLKAGVIKSPNDKLGPEFDQNVYAAADDYFTMYRDFYDIGIFNDTEDFLNVPEYTVEEIQSVTDATVLNNNGTATPIWQKYLEGVFSISNVTLEFDVEKVLVSNPDVKYLSMMATILSKEAPAKIELFIWIKVVEVLVVHTSAEFRDFFQKSIEELHEGYRVDSGVPPRSFHCAGAVNDMMGMAVAYGIADPTFHNNTQPKVQTMINEMKNSLAKLVSKARWMDANTKAATYEKISEMRSLIGFPDWLLREGELEKHYEGIEIKVNTHLKNMISVIQKKTRHALDTFKDIKNYSWASDPTDVNAYHSFQDNTITVPLVILQYPFYDLGLESLNYGSLGTVIGHEITHGFDNFGRQFDKNGNFLPWWSDATVESYVNMTECFVDQYSSFFVADLNIYVDGRKTLGENIADNGGVREAFGALQEHLTKNGPEPKLPGFEDMTSEQMFFLSFGNLWCEIKTTNEFSKIELEDEHSPQQFRARGPLQNYQEFAKAWSCAPNTPMNPSKKCVIF